MRTALPVAVLALAGCGGGDAYYGGDAVSREPSGGAGGSEGYYGPQTVASGGVAMDAPAPAAMPMAEADEDARFRSGGESGAEGWDAFEGRGEEARRQLVAQAPPQRRTPPPPPPPQTPTPQPQDPQQPQTATDATSGPLLIYEAILNLAVYQVEENQRAVTKVASDVGGYLSRQDDMTVVIRVPAAKFRDAVAAIEQLGDVLHRNIQALDVSEEFRDAQIRLRNSEQVRDRLAALLEQARNVEESLRIERELERITQEIELIKGRLRFLEDRIAYSTITVNFSPKEEENLEGEIFHLPFDFLYNLGLRTLLNLR